MIDWNLWQFEFLLYFASVVAQSSLFRADKQNKGLGFKVYGIRSKV